MANITKFDFNKNEYTYLIENICFSEEELKVLQLRRSYKSIKQISTILNMSTRTVDRRINSIVKKIYKFMA